MPRRPRLPSSQWTAYHALPSRRTPSRACSLTPQDPCYYMQLLEQSSQLTWVIMPAPLKHTVCSYCNTLHRAVFILYAVMLLCGLHLACLHALCNVYVGMILLGTMVKCLCTALNYIAMYIRMVEISVQRTVSEYT